MKKKKVLFVLFIILALPYAPSAGELYLIKGKGVPVCEALYKNLKELNFFEDMVCERDKYYPDQYGITRPKWEELNLKENKDLLKKIKKFLEDGDQFKKIRMYDDEGEFEGYLKLVSDIGDRMLFMKVDIDNDGKQDKLILYNDGRCMDTHVYSRALLVLDEVNNQIDVKKTEPLLQNTADPRAPIEAKVISHYQMYDVFFYKHQTYFDRWDTDDRTGTVYIDSKGITKEVCKYKYKK